MDAKSVCQPNITYIPPLLMSRNFHFRHLSNEIKILEDQRSAFIKCAIFHKDAKDLKMSTSPSIDVYIFHTAVNFCTFLTLFLHNNSQKNNCQFNLEYVRCHMKYLFYPYVLKFVSSGFYWNKLGQLWTHMPSFITINWQILIIPLFQWISDRKTSKITKNYISMAKLLLCGFRGNFLEKIILLHFFSRIFSPINLFITYEFIIFKLAENQLIKCQKGY